MYVISFFTNITIFLYHLQMTGCTVTMHQHGHKSKKVKSPHRRQHPWHRTSLASKELLIVQPSVKSFRQRNFTTNHKSDLFCMQHMQSKLDASVSTDQKLARCSPSFQSGTKSFSEVNLSLTSLRNDALTMLLSQPLLCTFHLFTGGALSMTISRRTDLLPL